jgi:hypothetical protein
MSRSSIGAGVKQTMSMKSANATSHIDANYRRSGSGSNPVHNPGGLGSGLNPVPHRSVPHRSPSVIGQFRRSRAIGVGFVEPGPRSGDPTALG